ncbi:uncharacterized protein LOC131285320 [Anopheles ziemanni]|uniref:uncharacterized protein LOC131265749 n=1 Tax=Anopheles coustani TaxID=139045 RepID=UPI00265901AF|nr:uncharacterized protein LOC131265749 [Anopheles coustani]XP_058170158.1 uncharacterized protein LOC131285320 [Anopheles ziemanni]
MVSTACLLPTVTILLLAVALVSAANDDFNIELKQKDAEVYHEQSFGRNEFNYGYQVEKTNSQFQHKAKGPDDVTYGCYGYIDPDGEKHLVYYIADRLGYRLLAPDQPTKVFTDRVANSVNKLDADLQGRKLDEKVVAWNDLYLPSTCRRLNEIVSITPPPTPTVVPVTTPRNGAGVVIDPITPARPQGPKEPIIGRPSTGGNRNDRFNGAPGEPNLGGDSSGTGNVQVPIVDESSQGKSTNEGRVPSTETPQTPSNNGFGVTKAPGDEAGVNLKDPRVPPNNGVGGGIGGGVPSGPVDLPRNDNFGTPQPPTQRPVRHEVTRTPLPPTPEPTPAPQQIDPIVIDPLPEATYPQPGPIETHHPQCGQQLPTTGPFPSSPKYPASIGQFNGFVFPINRDCDASGRSTADLLAQMQAINELVLKVSSTLREQTGGDAPDRNATCQRVLELLNVQQPVPLLVYVPIMIPYLDGGIQAGAGAQKPPINPASYAYAKSCSDCK